MQYLDKIDQALEAEVKRRVNLELHSYRAMRDIQREMIHRTSDKLFTVVKGIVDTWENTNDVSD